MEELPSRFDQSPCPENGGIRVLMLVDGITHDGGIRTRVSEEIRCLLRHQRVSVSVASRVYARNISEVGMGVRGLKAENRSRLIHGIEFPKLPNGGLPFVYEFSLLVNTAMSLLVLVPFVIWTRPNLIYAHNIECSTIAFALSKIFRIPWISDIHGVEIEEYFERNRPGSSRILQQRFWGWIEWLLRRQADATVCVSQTHKSVMEEEGARPDRVFVFPCFADSDEFTFDEDSRVRIRREMGVRDDEVLAVYSGIVPEPWDFCNPICFFSKILCKPGQRLLVISAVESFERSVAQVPVELANRIKIIHVPRRMVPAYLSAADIGLLIRNETLVNRVASPTKFSEYLLCGLPVIISRGIGDCTDLVERNGLGLVFRQEEYVTANSRPALDLAPIILPESRSKIRAIALKSVSSRVFCRGLTDLVVRTAK